MKSTHVRSGVIIDSIVGITFEGFLTNRERNPGLRLDQPPAIVVYESSPKGWEQVEELEVDGTGHYDIVGLIINKVIHIEMSLINFNGEHLEFRIGDSSQKIEKAKDLSINLSASLPYQHPQASQQ